MKIDLIVEPIVAIAELARIPIAFEVRSVFEVKTSGAGSGGFLLSEHKLSVPYLKDYDAINGEGPTQWAKRFDISRWGLIGVYANDGRVGAAVIAFGTKEIKALEGRADSAALLDIRILQQFRRKGVGSALFRAAEDWARAMGSRELIVETQNINVPACRLYESQGCVLGEIDRSAYPDFPDEIQLLWHKDILA